MNTIRYHILALTIGAVLCGHVQATGMIAGATEPTQMMNNIELMGSHLKKIQSVKKQIQQYTNQLSRLHNQVQMMRQLDPTKAADLLKGLHLGANWAEALSGRFEAAEEVGKTLDSLSGNLTSIYREGRIAHDVIADLQRAGHNITGNDYIGAMNALAQQRSDTYGVRIEQVKKASRAALDDADRLKRITALNPEIATEMEGLQAIIKTNENLSGLIAYNNQVVTEQTIAQMELNQAQILAVDEEHVRQEQKRGYFSSWRTN